MVDFLKNNPKAGTVRDTNRNPNFITNPKAGIVKNTNDASTAYANEYNYYLYFTHIPTGLTTSFKSFVTEFNDQFTSNWNDVSVYGRMDPISTFQGTAREISFSFDVVAFNLLEAKQNFINSQKLIQSLYPVYDEVSGGRFSATSIQAPPLLRIRFANLIAGTNQGLVGKLNGLSYQPDLEAGVFQKYDQVIPKVNRFSCVFTVFHTEGVGFNEDGNFRGGELFPYPSSDVEISDQAAPDPSVSSTPIVPADGAEGLISSLTKEQREELGVDINGYSKGVMDPRFFKPDFIRQLREDIEDSDEGQEE